ncbi:alkyl hydroperoxide reductase subunit AhpC [Bacillus mesophilus]|uniref:Redoxin domain-containing protein n=2 Tax=Bacillus mesophilus TaxID=1808955 RepID=A0A6M0QAC4_9BACI|nr:alkyl hydroperoxide reductase subunit AhpC [Bacillus mesophilus]NEY73207.1 redoxin domain-containing protein [Bacillus mesophilus]
METNKHNEWQGSCALPNCAQTNDMAPLFRADAYHHVEEKIKEVSLESYRGKWVVLFFYPSDFTFV